MKFISQRSSIAFALLLLGAVTAVPGCQLMGGGAETKGQNTSQSKAAESKPVDEELRLRMNMYKEIRKYELEQRRKLHKEEEERLKEMVKEQQKLLQQEIDHLEKKRKGTLYFQKDQKEQKEQKEQNQEGEKKSQQEQGQGQEQGQEKSQEQEPGKEQQSS